MSEAPPAFGELLRRLRSAAGLSQEDLAGRSGVSRNGISDLERGLYHTPRFETVRMLADALTLSEDERAALIAAARPMVKSEAPAARRPRSLVSLPAPLTRLIGRETELAALSAELQDRNVRLLTVTGPGGVGKTRLALAAAAELLETFLTASGSSTSLHCGTRTSCFSRLRVPSACASNPGNHSLTRSLDSSRPSVCFS